jgi:single-strand DNA-binding protein
VDGRLQIRTYEAQDGQRRWVTEVIAENVRFLSPKEGGQGAQTPYGHEVELDDDIPF